MRVITPCLTGNFAWGHITAVPHIMSCSAWCRVFKGGPTCESEGEKSGGSPSAYHCAWRLMLTRGRNRLNTCVFQDPPSHSHISLAVPGPSEPTEKMSDFALQHHEAARFLCWLTGTSG